MAADTVDRVAADTTVNEVVHTEDVEGVDAGEEDADHLLRKCRMQTYLQLAGNQHHFLVEEQGCQQHQIL